MIFNRFLKILAHPLFIGLLITAGIFFFAPPVFNKYRLKPVESNFIRGNGFYYYEDLDFDNNSERIQFDFNASNIIKIQLSKGSKTVSQSNLNNQPASRSFFYWDDYDNNRQKELFLFTFRNDSVFLNILDLLDESPYKLTDRYIDMQLPGSSKDEKPEVQPIGSVDYDRDGSKEFIFNLNTAFREQPRNVYIYNIYKDSLIKSPKSGASVSNPQLFDLTRDAVPEIIFGTHATGNIDGIFPFSDQVAWLMALDRNLDFVFNPVSFDKYPCRTIVTPLATENGNRLVVLHDYFGDDSLSSTLGIYDEKGRLLKEVGLAEYERAYANILPGPEDRKDRFYFIRDRQSTIELMDTGLRVISEIKGPALFVEYPMASMDADGDGKMEYLFMGNEDGLYYIVRNDFSSFVSFSVKSDLNPWHSFASVIQRGDDNPYLFMPLYQGSVTLEYSRNPWYVFRFILIIGCYLAISGFIYLIYLLQRYRARLHYDTTRRITELQMRSIKNQIDPHFTLNTLNAIGSLYATSENHETADYLFGKYARLLRQTVLTSDQVEVTLEQELEFVKNYLDLEKFRLNNKFEYSVEIGEGVDTSLNIPRMLIHTFAENAVKYAFKPMEGKGCLTIGIAKRPGKHVISMTDNGPGIHAAKKDPLAGTGKGLEIVDEMITLYYNLKKVKISYTLEEVREKGVCRGTRVEIEIVC